MLEIIANAKEDSNHHFLHHRRASLHQRTPAQESWSLLKVAAGHEDNREHIATYGIHTAANQPYQHIYVRIAYLSTGDVPYYQHKLAASSRSLFLTVIEGEFFGGVDLKPEYSKIIRDYVDKVRHHSNPG